MTTEALCPGIHLESAESSIGMRAFSVDFPQAFVEAKFRGEHVLFKSSEAVVSGPEEEALCLDALLGLWKKEARLDSTSGEKKNIGRIVLR